MPALLALFGPKQGLRVPLCARVLVGRGPSADLQLIDGKVSREHCRIDATGACPMIEDLASQNGTFVNGERIARATPLAEGDEIAVGETLLVVADDQVDIASARYGTGTLMVAGKGRASTAANPGPPLAAQTPSDGLRGIGLLAAHLAEAHDEEGASTAILDAVEAELAPKRSIVLLRVWQSEGGASRERAIALATRGEEPVASISRTLLERAATARHGLLVEDAFGSRELRGVRSVAVHSLRSVIVAPWGHGEEAARGFLYVDREAEHPFTLSDLAWLQAVAHLATLRLADRPQLVPRGASGSADQGPVGASPSFVNALGLATAAARAGSSVLLVGEPGTGSEDVACLIHRRSRQQRGPFVVVRCGALAEAAVESELFGHEKGGGVGTPGTRLGAFEAADGGTLFLEEVGDLSSALQARLLRVLQEHAVVRLGSTVARQVDVRIVASTHRDLAADVKARLFLEDLYLRLNVVSVVLPPLRERRDDVPLLARVLVDRIAARLGLRAPELSPDAEAALATWEYPGNVRELANVIERVLVLRDPRDPGTIDRDDVMAALGLAMQPAVRGPRAGDDRLSDSATRAERENLEAVLRRTRGVKSHAAKLLGISRPALDQKIAELGLDLWSGAD